MNRPHTLYRFWNGDQLLYVGITSDPGRRWKQHHKSKLWWGDVTAATLEHFPTRAELEAAEVTAIHAERPAHNVMHNRGHIIARAPRLKVQVDASEMPDMCHDHCVKAGRIDGMFYPHRWVDGTAHYQCDRGHSWTCGWGHTATGRAPECRRVNQAALARIERAKAGARIPAYIESVRQARGGGIIGTIGDCPFCGQRHTHGLGADPDRLNLGSRCAHCVDVSATYHLELPRPDGLFDAWGDLQPLTTLGAPR